MIPSAARGRAWLVSSFLALAFAAPAPTPPPALPLEGTRWALVGDGDSPGPAGTHDAYILLRRNGTSRRLGGSSGCNRVKGTYDTFVGRLRIDPSVLSGKPCPEPLAAQEARLLEALRRTANYRIEANTLTLLSADGKALARFRTN